MTKCLQKYFHAIDLMEINLKKSLLFVCYFSKLFLILWTSTFIDLYRRHPDKCRMKGRFSFYKNEKI